MGLFKSAFKGIKLECLTDEEINFLINFFSSGAAATARAGGILQEAEYPSDYYAIRALQKKDISMSEVEIMHVITSLKAHYEIVPDNDLLVMINKLSGYLY